MSSRDLENGAVSFSHECKACFQKTLSRNQGRCNDIVYPVRLCYLESQGTVLLENVLRNNRFASEPYLLFSDLNCSPSKPFGRVPTLLHQITQWMVLSFGWCTLFWNNSETQRCGQIVARFVAWDWKIPLYSNLATDHKKISVETLSNITDTVHSQCLGSTLFIL